VAGGFISLGVSAAARVELAPRDAVQPASRRFGTRPIAGRDVQGGGEGLGGELEGERRAADPAPEEGQDAADMPAVEDPEGLRLGHRRRQKLAVRAWVRGTPHACLLSGGAVL
jgi:hypothetical protein